MLSGVRYKVAIFVVLALVALLTLGLNYHLSRVSTEDPDEQPLLQQHPPPTKVTELYSLYPVRKAPKKITTTVFMFRGDFSSPYYDIFALHKRAVRYCDKDTTIGGCDVKLPGNYKWGTLSSKLVDALEHMCKAPKKTDFYVKADDDLIMSDSKLDEVIRVMATTNCEVAGGIITGGGFYWPLGQVYIFKRSVLEEFCQKFPITMHLHSSEDISFGLILNSTDPVKFCHLNTPTNHWHINYKDQRVQIKYFTQHNE